MRGGDDEGEGRYFGWEAWGEDEWKGSDLEEGGKPEGLEDVPLVDPAEVIDWEAIERDLRG